MMGHREPLKGGDEFDFLTKMRRWHGRPDKAKEIKRGFSKRVRRHAKCSIPVALMMVEDEPGPGWSWHTVMYQEGDGYEW